MLRGAKKNMIVVRTRDSRVFEEAYFVMRRDRSPTSVDEADMLWEAHRILESAHPQAERAPRAPRDDGARIRWRDWIWFGVGLISGGGVTGLLWWLL